MPAGRAVNALANRARKGAGSSRVKELPCIRKLVAINNIANDARIHWANASFCVKKGLFQAFFKRD
jgi:hypothetical protein